MKKILLTITLILIGLISYSQVNTNREHVSTKVPDNSRFEIIQSNIGAKLTFKVDKYLGEVYQLASTGKDEQIWIKMLRLDHIADYLEDKNKVNYQLFTSGLGMKFTYLMNLDTGATWILAVDKKEDYLWEPQQ